MQSAILGSLSPIEDDMALGDRVLDVERKLSSFHGYAKGAAAVGLLLIAAICWWVNFNLMPEIQGLSTSLKSYDSRISTIEGQLKEIDLKQRATKTPQAVLAEMATLNNRQFSGVLPALQDVLTQPFDKVKPSISTLQEISIKLHNADTNAPEYWPTVLQFLQFVSAGLAPATVPLPNTRPVFRSSSRSFLVGNQFSGITVLLDGGSLNGDRFDNCRVIFTNSPVKMENVTFTNSIFEFPVSSNPSPYIQHASKLLLASDLKTASIPSL
jgi:hypothetical protein